MKKIFITIPLLSICILSFGQDNDVKLSDLKTPNSPGFQLLDISPSSVDRPTNPKEFSLKVLNLFSDGSALPKNFAFEFTPFWYFKKKNETIYKYLGAGSDNDSLKAYWSTGLLRKFNFSLASTFSDSTSGSLLKNTNYVSFGLRTNLFTFRTAQQNKKINHALLAAAKRIDELQGRTDLTLEQIEKMLDDDKIYKEALNVANKLPLLQLDGAFAYSNAFADNSFSNRRFNRWALWGSFAINADFKKERQEGQNAKKTQDIHSLSFIFLIKTLRDNALTDTSHFVFSETNALDYGGKIEYNINRLSLSIEYIKRNYDNNDHLNSERTVGVIQYKISDNLYATGTYGKNFGNFKNVFSLLGLNWGLGNTKLKTE